MQLTRRAAPRLHAVTVVQAVLVTLTVVELALFFKPDSKLGLALGHDVRVYVDAAERWLAGGSYFHPYQLAGPYPVVDSEILYPPVALVLFVPFTVLPTPLWWMVPLGIIAAVVAWYRPRPWAVTAILALIALPFTGQASWTLEVVFTGNPVIWAGAFVALATRYRVFGPFALLKPTPLLVPFAAIWIRTREWWIGLAILIGVALLFAPTWRDYITVIGNAQTPMPAWLYAATSVPLMLIPVVAWLGRSSTESH